MLANKQEQTLFLRSKLIPQGMNSKARGAYVDDEHDSSDPVHVSYLLTSEIDFEVSFKLKRLIIYKVFKTDEVYKDKPDSSLKEATLLDFQDCYISAQIVSHGIYTHGLPIMSHSGRFSSKVSELSINDDDDELLKERKTRMKNRLVSVEFNEWLRFPVSYKDLEKDTELHLRLHKLDSSLVGSCCVNIFSSQSVGDPVLNQGLFTGSFPMFNDDMITTVDNVLPTALIDNTDSNASSNGVSLVGRLDHRSSFIIRKFPQVKFGEAESDWVIVQRNKTRDIETANFFWTQLNMQEKDASWPLTSFSIDFQSVAFSVPVMFREKRTSDNLLDDFSLGPYQMPSTSSQDSYLDETDNLEVITDPVKRKEMRENIDKNLIPSRKEKEQIEKAIDSITASYLVNPKTACSLLVDSDESDLLWRFQHYLSNDQRVMLPFVMIVNWKNGFEEAQAKKILNKWRNLGILDALQLLGNFSQNIILKKFGVQILDNCKDSEILKYLLQLVQALRFDIVLPELQESNAFPEIGLLTILLVHRATKCFEIASFLMWHIEVEVSREEMSPLGVYKHIQQYFYYTLQTDSKNSGSSFILNLDIQKSTIKKIMSVFPIISSGNEKAYLREETLKSLLREDPSFSELLNLPYPVALPLYPAVKFVRIKPESARVIPSNAYPIVLDLILGKRKKSREHGKADLLKRLMFKCGDDLRQDQLAVQLISLIDIILKKNGLNMHFTIYKVLATGQNEGIVEFVNRSFPMSKIIANFGSISGFFRENNPFSKQKIEQSETDSYINISVGLLKEARQDGVDPKVLDRFIKSCAGYCVISYLLGIGDRHLDNLMLKPSGEMFHIDFGYMFGKDPKTFASEIRLTKEMIMAMGGRESHGYQRFRTYCSSSFRVLRKNGSVLISLLGMMRNAGVPDLSITQDFDAVIARFREKFQLRKTDEEAEKYLLGLVDRGADAYAPVIYDIMHRVAVSRK